MTSSNPIAFATSIELRMTPSRPRVLYLSFASDDVYALVREAAGTQFEVVTLKSDDDAERFQRSPGATP